MNMETRKRIDYKALCEAPFDMDSEYEVNFRMLVYTGRKEEERPVFRVVIAKGACKVVIGQQGKEFWESPGWIRRQAKRSGTTTTTASAWRIGRCWTGC